MKVIIAGSRRYDDYAELISGIEASGFGITEVVSGGAKGADSLGERWAKERGIPIQRFDADWDAFGKRAGHIRNGEMAAYAEALVAFPLADSRGTQNMISEATQAGLLVHIHRIRYLCHANGCQADDCHPELPFCRSHFGQLSDGLRKRLWNGRRLDHKCGACEPGEPLEVRLRAADDWAQSFNLALAALHLKDHGVCPTPTHLQDEDGFCWACGVHGGTDTYAKAQLLS